MNASWGNGVPLIVQRVVPPLRLSRFFSPRSFAALFRSFIPPLSRFLPLSLCLSLQRRRRVRSEFKMHGYASFILNYELEPFMTEMGESNVTEREWDKERRRGRRGREGKKKRRFAALSSNSSGSSRKKSRWEWNFWYLWHWLHARLVEHRRFYPVSSERLLPSSDLRH